LLKINLEFALRKTGASLELKDFYFDLCKSALISESGLELRYSSYLQLQD
jgi:hypothetical protein